MPRALVVGNGNMLATFDDHLLLRDFYYPHVGLEDHTLDGNAHRIGFWVNGRFSWLDESSWQTQVGFAPSTMVGDCVAENRSLGLVVRFQDFVHTTHNVLIRKVTIKNTTAERQNVKAFFHHDFHIEGSKTKDTAQYEPDLNGVLHYRLQRYFFISGLWEDGAPLDQFTVGKSGYAGKEGTFRDAEDGHLHGNAIDQGSVDSTIGFSAEVPAGGESVLYVWVVAGKKYHDIAEQHRFVLEATPQTLLHHTASFWKHWVERDQLDFADLPPDIIELYKKSLLIIRTQIDNDGAIIAANDSDIMLTNRDNYSYMWPRDGALTSITLCEAGYPELAQKFLDFTSKLVTAEGYLLNKYNADGSLGSSWHPKWKNGESQLPIQEDETALFLLAFLKYYEATHDLEYLRANFHQTILPVAEWLHRYKDEKTGLPLPSYDLWEQDRGACTYIASTVFAALYAAADICTLLGHTSKSNTFRRSAEALHEAICTHLYSEEHGRFLRQVTVIEGEISNPVAAIDVSLIHLWQLGVLPVDDKRIELTMTAIEDRLMVPGNIGGIARFENDPYQFDYANRSHHEFPGNPWIISTLWLAEYHIRRAKTLAELEKCKHNLLWTLARANAAGILPEQSHPVTGMPLSVAPLTWSHAAFVSTVLQYLSKRRELAG